MKRFLFCLMAMVAIVGCTEAYDDTDIRTEIDDLKGRVTALEKMCKEMNTNIASLQTIVGALQTNDYITNVSPIVQNGKTIGYTISFAKAQPITIYHGTDGKDGQDGQDGADGEDGKDSSYVPQIGVKQDVDGVYYWTLDGEWLLDENGNKVKAVGTDGKDGENGKDGVDGEDGKDGENGQDGKDGVDGEDGQDGADGKDGITPQLKIENDYWYISYDNGQTWTMLGKATGEDGADGKDGQDGTDGTNGADGKDGESFFQSVTQDEHNVYFTLADGTVITVPKGTSLNITFAESDLVVMSPNSTREISYTVMSTTETVTVEVTSSADVKAKVIADDDSGLTGKIRITTGATIDEYSKVIVFVSNEEKVIMRSITFEEAGLVVEENTTKSVAAEGGNVTLEFLSNVSYEVVIPEDAQSWISVVPSTRAMEKHTVVLELEPNEGATRSAEVIVKSQEGNLSLTYTIEQEPNLDYQLALEREALIAIYNALDGDNWINNENWCSDKPVGEWYGIYTHNDGTIRNFHLENNCLTGEVPNDLLKLKKLEQFNIRYNNISTIPSGISSLTKLNSLSLPPLSNIPIEELYNLSEISNLWLEINAANLPYTDIDLNRWKKLHSATISANKDDYIALPNDFTGLSKLYHLCLIGFSGELSPTIDECEQLQSLVIQDGTVTGEIPSTIGNLKHLSQLDISNNQFSGSIPKELFSCPLDLLYLDHNRLSGEIPKEFGDWLSSMQDQVMAGGGFGSYLHYNYLSSIPESIQKHPIWNVVWPYIIIQKYNCINHKEILLPGLHLSGCDIDGNEINSETDYAKYDYTIIWQIAPELAVDPMFLFNVYQMNDIYEKYKDKNIKFIYMGQEWNTEEELRNFRDNNDVMWQTFNVNRNVSRRLLINYGGCTSYLPSILDEVTRGNQVCIVDKGRNIVYSSILDGVTLNVFLEKILGNAGSELYKSSDYSQDGTVATLQTATKGEGIDIVLMGDAYCDRQIADGTYKADMENLYNNLFTEEPYKSFKDYFNVYYVNVVSKNEGYGTYNETALSGYFGNGTEVGGNDGAVFNYALNAISEEEMDEALLIVAMNSNNYAGTCYMYYPQTSLGYGNGVSIAYFPKGGDQTTFAQLLHHEACGHGFAKLADEYAYESMGAIPSEEVTNTQTQQTDWGWWKNVDFTSDTSAVRWAKFISDSRYANEKLGAYEGAMTYWTGVWRPTENSIMRYNTGGFNAPSREAIYYRIHKLAYGDEWTYDYETFVKYDEINRTTTTTTQSVPMIYKPTAPPVVMKKNWRDELR